MPGLRERQKAMARESITEAAAALVTERHQLDFSMQEVADRAGVSLRTVYNKVDLAEGSFDTTLAGLNVGLFFTPRIYLQSLVQYSTQVNRWSSNIRFSLLNTAGTGLFVVFNSVEGIQDLDGNLSRSFIVKYTHQFNILGG